MKFNIADHKNYKMLGNTKNGKLFNVKKFLDTKVQRKLVVKSDEKYGYRISNQSEN
jgi:hypothetical protein